MLRPLLLAAALVASTAATATAKGSDIAWKIDRMAPGSTLVLRNDDGTVYTHMRRNAQEGEVQFDTFAGSGPAAAYIGSYFTNERGEVKRTISVDGEMTTFTPHKCMRTVGECRYTITHADGSRENRVRITEVTRRGLKFKEYGVHGLMRSGAQTLDRMGSNTAGWVKDHFTGQETKVKLVRAAYR